MFGKQQSHYPFLISNCPMEDEHFILTGYELQYKCPGKLISVVLCGDPFSDSDEPESVEVAFLRRLDEAGTWSDDGPESEDAALQRTEEVESDITDFVERLCRPLFLRLANVEENERPSKEKHQPFSLQQHMHPEAVNLQIVTKDGRPEVIRREGLPPRPQFLPNKDIVIPEQANWPPVYHPAQVEIIEVIGQWILKVSADGQVACCKLNALHDVIAREYQKLKKITDSGISSIRVPNLRGLVGEKEGGVLGILLDYIEPQHRTLIAALDGLGDEKVSRDRRAKWATQVEHGVRQLHAIDVIWGDAKPDNVLIDQNDDAWLLDFGGGWTEGWVDKDLANSTRGDLQGVERIRTMLGAEG